MKRRSFLALLGAAPVAGKITIDAEVAKGVGLNVTGLGDATMRLPGGAPLPASYGPAENVPYERRLIGAADYIKAFGIPAHVDVRIRDEARYVHSLDPDIACKMSWSMSVKIMTQRQRNYERAAKRIEQAGWQERGRQRLQTLLGFEWPW